MARAKGIQVTDILGQQFYIYMEELETLGVPDPPVSFVQSCMSGSRSAALRVNTQADLQGSVEYLNPRMIVRFKVL
jgi:hypothetical protein